MFLPPFPGLFGWGFYPGVAPLAPPRAIPSRDGNDRNRKPPSRSGYNPIVRSFLVVCFLLAPFAGEAQLKERSEPLLEEDLGLVDEDEDQLIEKQYVFNPILARKEFKVGNFYAKKGSHRAAAGRYLEATRWDPNFSEAYWKLGRSREKLKQADAALEAYRKYLDLDPTGRYAKTARKRMAGVERLAQAQARDNKPTSQAP